MIDTILFGVIFSLGWLSGFIGISPLGIVEAIILFFVIQYLFNCFYEKK